MQIPFLSISWCKRVIEKHPKLTKKYKSGVGGRFLILGLDILVLAITVVLEFFLVQAFIESGFIAGIGMLIVTALWVGLFSKYCLAFSALGFYHARTGLRYKAGKLLDKIFDDDKKETKEEPKQEPSAQEEQIIDTPKEPEHIGEVFTETTGGGVKVEDMKQAPTKQEVKVEDNPQTPIKTHNILDMIFGIIGFISILGMGAGIILPLYLAFL